MEPNHRLKLTAPRAPLEAPQLNWSVRRTKGKEMRARTSLVAFILALSTCHGGGTIPLDIEGTWGTPQRIDTSSMSGATSPQIATEAGGDAIVVWDQGDEGIGFNRFVAGTGWGIADIVPDSVGGVNSRVASDRNGHLIAVWQRLEGFTNVIRANRYVAGQGWGVAHLVSADNSVDSLFPEIASDRYGNAVVVWRQDNVIGANQYNAANGWGTATVISDSTEIALEPEVAFDNNGNALAVWYQSDGTYQTIRSRRYSLDGGWDAPIMTLDNAWTYVDFPQIAMNDRGDAMAVWQKSETDNVIFSTNVWAKRYAPGTGWGPATVISDNTGYAMIPRVAIDSNGNAIAIWRQFNGTKYVTWANRYSEGHGWGSAVIIGPEDAGDAFPSQVSTDSEGNAIAVWTQALSGPWHVWVNRHRTDKGWGAPSLLDNSDVYRASSPRFAMDDVGNATAVWYQFPNSGVSYTVWARRFEKHSP